MGGGSPIFFRVNFSRIPVIVLENQQEVLLMREIVPRLVAWESTRACNLACVHCRASAQLEHHPQQLSTSEVQRVMDEIAEFSRPILIITGGEPLMRADIFDIASYATRQGLRVVMSPNGTLLTPEVVRKMKASGVMRISVSLDGSSPERNDSFRQVPGAFQAATRGLAYAREAGLPFQINTTVTRRNQEDLPAMLKTVIDLGAVTWDVFMLVPTGRGKIEDEVSPEQYEQVLNWIYEVSRKAPIPVKVTCGPHYVRIFRQRAKAEGRSTGEEDGPPGHGLAAKTPGGCLAGKGFCFISHIGEVFPCGYFPIPAGNVRQQHFREIYQESELFKTLRDATKLKGKCGHCEYRVVCSGCRARALGARGDYMEEEPFCIYEPRGVRSIS